MIEARDAPSEYRIAISCCRSAVLASSSAAMLVQAIRSSTETAANSSQSDRPTSPTITSLSASTRTPSLASVSG
jgi:hypothetical protein